LTVQRFPRGIGGKGFVQQDFADTLPAWMSGVEVEKDGGTLVHALAERPEALRWLANQNCVTLHVWQSRRDRLHHPDRLVFDLDPSDNDFAVVRATARAVAGVLDDLGLACYVQTTGSRGLHVVTPVRADADFDTVRQFARDVAAVVAADDAAHRTVEARKDKRGDRVYLDIMRNAYAQTAVAQYSVRARKGAPVATPLEWDELDTRGLRSDQFTIRTLPKRLGEQRDPWAGMYRHARSLAGPAKRLAKLRA
jgi:bifunctional non-homologous end joining protein LigD